MDTSESPIAAIGINQLWGFSPSFDLQQRAGAALDRGKGSPDTLHFLLAGAHDFRHVLHTLAEAQLSVSQKKRKKLHFYLCEDTLEAYGRTLLFFLMCFDGTFNRTDRTETLLEVFGNVMVRKKTHEYVSVLCKVLLASLRTMIDTLEDAEEDFDFDLEGLDLTTPSGSTSSSAPSSSPSSEDAKSAASADNNDNEPLQAHEFIPLYFDISNLRYKERDGLEAAVRGWMDDKVVDMKMQELFEYRLRSYYGTRFDVKTNLIDWDYSMRQIKDNASIIHPVHYRKWRSKGIAFELRDCDYNTTNTTLLTTRDAQQKKKGRINLRGYWGDIMLTPYLAFGIQANQKSLFEVANKVHKKNSHHVAEYNISSWTHQIQERSRYVYVDDTTHGHKNDTKQEEKKEEGKESLATVVEEVEDEDEEEEGGQRSDGEQEEEDARGNALIEPILKRLAALKHVKIHLMGKDLGRLARKKAFKGRFDCVFLGQSKLLECKQEFNALLNPKGASLFLENIKYLPFSEQQKAGFVDKVSEIAAGLGWTHTEKPAVGHDVFSFAFNAQ